MSLRSMLDRSDSPDREIRGEAMDELASLDLGSLGCEELTEIVDTAVASWSSHEISELLGRDLPALLAGQASARMRTSLSATLANKHRPEAISVLAALLRAELALPEPDPTDLDAQFFLWEVLTPIRSNDQIDVRPIGDVLTEALVADRWIAEGGSMLDEWTKSGRLDAEFGRQCSGQLVPVIVDLSRVVADALADGPRNDLLSRPDYTKRIGHLGFLVDTVGRLGGPDFRQVLTDAAAHPDPYVALYGLINLLKQGATDPDVAEQVARVAGDPTCRLELLQTLSADAMALVPAELRTQAAIAESELTNWVASPMEANQPPLNVEQLGVATIGDADSGTEDLYVFRFAMAPEHVMADQGWMVGVAGAYPTGGEPMLYSSGFTFSSFTKQDDMPLEAHVESLVGVVVSIRQHLT